MNARGLILAAGAGTRFGGRPSSSRTCAAGRCSQHALEAMTAALDARGRRARPRRRRDPRAGRLRRRARSSICEDWAHGQGSRCGAASRRWPAPTRWSITLGDQPFITPQVITGALGQLAGLDAVRAVYDGAPGHPVVLARSVLDAVGELEGDAGARELLARFRVREWEAGHLADATDIDTQAELARAYELELGFDVAAPIEAVWPALIDIERVAPCLPGAVGHGRRRTAATDGEFTLRVGPFAAVHRGTIRIEFLDEASRVHAARRLRRPTARRLGRDARQHPFSEVDGATHVATAAELDDRRPARRPSSAAPSSRDSRTASCATSRPASPTGSPLCLFFFPFPPPPLSLSLFFSIKTDDYTASAAATSRP